MKYVYQFTEGNANMRELLGGKGANLAEMTSLGLPVPGGFVITTEACNRYFEDGQKVAPEIVDEIYDTMVKTEKLTAKSFGDPNNPLLVAVRSGSRASMPGMMDTILNLGLNDQVVEGLAKLTNNERFAYDSYRRFIQMFSDVVEGIDKSKFDEILDKAKEDKGVDLDTDLEADDLKDIVRQYKELFAKEKGVEFPQDPKEQLLASVIAVFKSWNNDRAIYYRRMHNIPSDWGTAVNVQSMVYGNMGDDSGTGVAFTRDPSTGENILYGEFLMNSQGEDVVAGIRTPEPISHLKDINREAYDQFYEISKNLEKHYKDMQDLEFTIEKGKLYILQTRSGKRTAQAALQIAVDLVEEGMITKEEALLQIDPNQLDALLHPTFEPSALDAASPIAKGLPASPGAATGKVYFTAEKAKDAFDSGEKSIILVRIETSPEDIEGMNISSGILTGRGGMTSHAAVVARGMGRCCVAGCSEININESAGYFIDKNGNKFSEGDWISLNGSTGNVYGTQLPTIDAELTGTFAKLMEWTDEFRTLGVRTNADSPKDAKVAKDFGAEGIGLCRTEHMFFESDRIFPFRKMILASSKEEREKALGEILPMQRADFEGIFKVMDGAPVTVRLLDPPLHEFMPQEENEIKQLASAIGVSLEELKAKLDSLHEINPMLGHRGCRLAVSYPEIAVMQTRAIMEAAINVIKSGTNVVPEIMIPLVAEVKELEFVKSYVKKTAEEVIKENNIEVEYFIGTMIEIPRACLTADAIAKEAEFFSFGTNDLTQMAYGLSRDDAGTILEDYYKANIFESDPTARLDQTGVGQLVSMAVERGKMTNPDLPMGICGEHGGEPSSIEFCHKVGLTYVSCSPFRVPIARLAAAIAAIKNK